MMRVVICGSRTWTDKETIYLFVCALPLLSEVITGGARGADTIADAAAEEFGHFRIIFPANWKGQGKAAGPLRNLRMLDMKPDRVIAFRAKGQSVGTDVMVRECKRRGIPVRVVTEGDDSDPHEWAA